MATYITTWGAIAPVRIVRAIDACRRRFRIARAMLPNRITLGNSPKARRNPRFLGGFISTSEAPGEGLEPTTH